MAFEGVVSEKFDLGLDMATLWKSLEPLIQKYPSVQRSAAFGGWAVQGHSGSYHDGWSMAFCPFNGPGNLGPSWNPRDASERAMVPVQNYCKPTDFYNGELHAVIQKLESLGLNPRRGRVIKIPPKSQTVWHKDGNKILYQARLHIPLVTNSGCLFETEQGSYHMPADGNGYFVHINQFHRAVNMGEHDRYHLVFHVWDQKHLTQFHRYSKNLYDFEADHPGEVDIRAQFRT